MPAILRGHWLRLTATPDFALFP